MESYECTQSNSQARRNKIYLPNVDNTWHWRGGRNNIVEQKGSTFCNMFLANGCNYKCLGSLIFFPILWTTAIFSANPSYFMIVRISVSLSLISTYGAKFSQKQWTTDKVCYSKTNICPVMPGPKLDGDRSYVMTSEGCVCLSLTPLVAGWEESEWRSSCTPSNMCTEWRLATVNAMFRPSAHVLEVRSAT
jgi:hypothetical protein